MPLVKQNLENKKTTKYSGNYVNSTYVYVLPPISFFLIISQDFVAEDWKKIWSLKMRIGLFYDEFAGISSSIMDIGMTFELLGHDVVYVDATDDLRAHNFLFGYKLYSSELFRRLYRLSFILNIPIIDRKWCCHNLSMLIGGSGGVTEGGDRYIIRNEKNYVRNYYV